MSYTTHFYEVEGVKIDSPLLFDREAPPPIRSQEQFYIHWKQRVFSSRLVCCNNESDAPTFFSFLLCANITLCSFPASLYDTFSSQRIWIHDPIRILRGVCEMEWEAEGRKECRGINQLLRSICDIRCSFIVSPKGKVVLTNRLAINNAVGRRERICYQRRLCGSILSRFPEKKRERRKWEMCN